MSRQHVLSMDVKATAHGCVIFGTNGLLTMVGSCSRSNSCAASSTSACFRALLKPEGAALLWSTGLGGSPMTCIIHGGHGTLLRTGLTSGPVWPVSIYQSCQSRRLPSLSRIALMAETRL